MSVGLYESLVPAGVDPVPIHEYEHPDWDMRLILLAEPDSRRAAEELLGDRYSDEHGDHNDPTLLTVTERTMPREEFVNLPEFDG